jgi:Domain of unknown function (DUF4365)
MSNSTSSDNLGPLPKVDRNDELQSRSIAMFRAFLPSDKFRFRDERTDDAGVDGSLELLINSSSTNLRSQVQLKSTDSDNSNADGSVSVQVRVSNLNYLLNGGSSPIYVLYVNPRNELRFLWARDERKRLDEINSDWINQESITIRFYSILTSETLEEIYQRVRQEALLQRKFNDILDAASNTKPVVISINTETLDITDPNRAKDILLRSGTAIVAAGYVTEIKNLIRLLNLNDAQLPRILLVHANAEYVIGRYQAAFALLNDASLRSDELSEEDRFFLQMLRGSCEFQTGRISTSEWSERLDQSTASQGGRFRLSYQLNKLRYAIRSEKDPSRRTILFETLKTVVQEIGTSPDNSPTFKLLARICLVEAQGQLVTLTFLRELGDARIKLSLGLNPNLPALLQLQTDKLIEWEQEAIKLLKDAIAEGSPLVVADAILVRGNISFHAFSNQKALGLLFSVPVEISEASIKNNIESAQQAVDIYAQADNLEGKLRAMMLIADFYDLIGREVDAQGIAREVLPKAKAMEYAATASRAQEYLSGQSPAKEMEATLREKSQEEKTEVLRVLCK